MKFSKWRKVIFRLGMGLVLTIFVRTKNSAMGQTPSPAISGTPTISANSVPVKKKKPVHNPFKNQQFVPVTMQDAREAEDKKNRELEKEGKLKGFGTVHNFPKPAMPSNFKIKPGNGIAYLSWDPVPGAGQYILYISEDGKNYKRRVFSPIKKTSIVIGLLTNGKTYYFSLEAIGGGVKRSDRALQTVVPVNTNPIEK